MRRLLFAVLSGAMLAGVLAPVAGAVDYPVAGTQLVLRERNDKGLLNLVLRDPSIPVPVAGSADDPSRGQVRVTLVERGRGDDASFSTYRLPELWNVRTTPRAVSYGYRDRTATRFGGELRTVNMRTGGGVRLTAKATGFSPSFPLDAVAVRVEFGSIRVCALFDGDAVRRNLPGHFAARNADAAGLADCDDATLAGLPAATATPFPTPTPAGGGTCCGCGCAPPYYLNCPFSQHQCSVPAPGMTSNDQCDAYDVPGQLDCEFITACNAESGGIFFPYCTGL